MYRRPCELAKVRYVACMEHRAQSQVISGITEAQQRGLSLGREKGTNHRTGYKHKEESKRKTSIKNKQFWKDHPEELKRRGEKLRGDKHYRWKGGVSKLNISIRQMHENRKWMDAVKERDGACVRCGSKWRLEAHHKIGLAEIIEYYEIKDREDARGNELLWDINNGETICELCHYKEHDRRFTLKIDNATFEKMPPHLKALFKKLPNPARDEVVRLFPEQAGGGNGDTVFATGIGGEGKVLGGKERSGAMVQTYADNGSAARFFYTTKANGTDREDNRHPTVKPTDLMQYLVRLVAAKDALVMDPFMGSGSTGVACIREGMRFIGIEQSEEYCDIAVGRLKHELVQCGYAKPTPPPPVKVLKVGVKK